ncbi:hypothetical protein F5879DRAFT_811985 [Lentinula edodes]|nr:hypothetical protein F5879DRAFT_811985 [Lentinula edodes]KAJ3916603.1 hypothetical protein F5877DRAFT_46267 [Lentinula edodes]
MVEAQEIACSLQPRIEKLIKDEISLPSWEPAFNAPNLKVPQDHKDFIHDLKIPRARAPHNHLPDMLLYELGRFQQDEQLKARLQGLFTKHPNHKIFVNTSGAGKTRLVLEHLCSSWGLYFSCHDDSHVGSEDVPSAMSNIRDTLFGSTLPHAPNLLKDVPKSEEFRHALERNQQIAWSELLVPLLSRLLVFQQYVIALQRTRKDLSQMDHKRRWLHLQLHPHLLSSSGSEEDDPFNQLSNDLIAWFEKQDIDLSERISIMRLLSKAILVWIREALGQTKTTPIYIVIDECQFAVTYIEDLFRSADWTAKRGILRELARCWDRSLNHTARSGTRSSAFIFTGTGLSRELISDVLSSVVAKTQTLSSVYNTGAFDDVKAQAAYLERFFPPELWHTSGRVRDRIYYWLRGRQLLLIDIYRYRFTAEYMSLALQCGYQNMHQLLDQYINSVACFRPADFKVPEKNLFGIVELPSPAFEFEKLNERMRQKIKIIAHEYLFTSKLESHLGSDERAYIELGLARISGYDGQKSVKIDEPLVLLACSVWFNEQRPHTVYKTLADQIDHHYPSSGRNGFEEFMSYYLLQIFRKPIKLNEVFDFEGGDDKGLGDREGQLVTLHLDESQRLVEGKVSLVKGDSTLFGPIGLGIGTRDHFALNEWLSLKRRTTFCFPMNSMGPDIMCFLKLEGENLAAFSYVCLAIQCKYHRTRSLEPETLRGAIGTVTPRLFFQVSYYLFVKDSSLDRVSKRANVLNALQSLKFRDPSAGKYGIIRIICGFPVNRQRVITQDPDEGDNHLLGKLRTSLLISATKDEHPTDILDIIRDSAVNAKENGMNYFDENDPAVLEIDQRGNAASVDCIVMDSAEIETLLTGSKRKRNHL